MWSDDYDHVWELLGFVEYEEIDLPIVQEARPIIKAAKSVALFNARWCMIRIGAEWRIALDHDDFIQPVDLTRFNLKYLKKTLSQKWQRILLKPEAAL